MSPVNYLRDQQAQTGRRHVLSNFVNDKMVDERYWEEISVPLIQHRVPELFRSQVPSRMGRHGAWRESWPVGPCLLELITAHPPPSSLAPWPFGPGLHLVLLLPLLSEPHLQCERPGFHPWVRKIPWRRKWKPTPVFLPRESHGQRSLAG